MYLYTVEQFAGLARKRRVSLGLTQTQLAEAIGRTHTWVSEFESGRKVPLLDSALLVAQALGLEIDVADNPRETHV